MSILERVNSSPLQLHTAVAEMEKEKFELQKRHTENIQELLEDTNVRLNKMEGDYAAQMQSTVRLLPVWSL